MKDGIVELAEYRAGDQFRIREYVCLRELSQEACKVRVFAVITPSALAVAGDEVKRCRSLEEFLRTPQSAPSVHRGGEGGETGNLSADTGWEEW